MSGSEALRHYRALPYRKAIERMEDADGVYYVCRFPDLPGCAADGTTPAEAVANAYVAFDSYILSLLQWGDDIATPAGSERLERATREEKEGAQESRHLCWLPEESRGRVGDEPTEPGPTSLGEPAASESEGGRREQSIGRDELVSAAA